MHRNRTDRLIRRLVIFGLLATGAAIGAVSAAPANAAALSAAPANAATRSDGETAQLAAGSGSQALVAAEPVLVDFTPDPADPSDDDIGAVQFQAPEVGGLTTGRSVGPGAAGSPGSYMAGEGCSIQCITSGVDPYPCIEAFADPLLKGPGFGSSDCHHWSYASLMPWADDLDARPADATSWVEHTLDRILYVPVVNEALRFSVPVQLHVTYEEV